MGLINRLQTSRDEDFDETLDYIHLSANELDAMILKITDESNQIIKNTHYRVFSKLTKLSDSTPTNII